MLPVEIVFLVLNFALFLGQEQAMVYGRLRYEAVMFGRLGVISERLTSEISKVWWFLRVQTHFKWGSMRAPLFHRSLFLVMIRIRECTVT